MYYRVERYTQENLDLATALQTGKTSEFRAQRVIKGLDKLVQGVIRTTRKEDDAGKDFWVTFQRSTLHDPIPLQVKSCFPAIQEFIENPRNKALLKNGLIILNAGVGVSDEDIRRAFLIQLQRIDGFIFPERRQLTKPRISPNINLWERKLAS